MTGEIKYGLYRLFEANKIRFFKIYFSKSSDEWTCIEYKEGDLHRQLSCTKSTAFVEALWPKLVTWQ